MAAINDQTVNTMEQPSLTNFQVFANNWIDKCHAFSSEESTDLKGFSLINMRLTCTFFDHIFPHHHVILFTILYLMFAGTTYGLKYMPAPLPVHIFINFIYAMFFVAFCKVPTNASILLVLTSYYLVDLAFRQRAAENAADKISETIKKIFSKTQMFSLSTIEMIEDLTEFLAGNDIPDRPKFVRNLFVYAIAEGNDVSALAEAFQQARLRTFQKPTSILWHTVPIMSLYCSYLLSLYDFDGSRSVALSLKITLIATVLSSIFVTLRIKCDIRRPIANIIWWGVYLWTMQALPKSFAAISVEQPAPQQPNLLILSWFQFVIGMVFMIASIIFLERDMHPASVLSKAMSMYNGNRIHRSSSSGNMYRGRSHEHASSDKDWILELLTIDLSSLTNSSMRKKLHRARKQSTIPGFEGNSCLSAVEHRLREYGFNVQFTDQTLNDPNKIHPWTGRLLNPMPLDAVDPNVLQCKIYADAQWIEGRLSRVGETPIDRPTVPIFNPEFLDAPPEQRAPGTQYLRMRTTDNGIVYFTHAQLRAIGFNVVVPPGVFFEDLEEDDTTVFITEYRTGWKQQNNYLLSMYLDTELILIEPGRLTLVVDWFEYEGRNYSYSYVDIDLERKFQDIYWAKYFLSEGFALHPAPYFSVPMTPGPHLRFNWPADPQIRESSVRCFYMMQQRDFIVRYVSLASSLKSSPPINYAVEHMDTQVPKSDDLVLDQHTSATKALLSINIDSATVMKQFCDFTALLTSLITSMDIEDPLARNLNRGSALYSYCKDHFPFIISYLRNVSSSMQFEVLRDSIFNASMEHVDEELSKDSGIFQWISSHIDMVMGGSSSALFGAILPVILVCPFFTHTLGSDNAVTNFLRDVSWRAHDASRAKKGIDYLIDICTNFFNHFVSSGPNTRERTTELQKLWVDAVKINVTIITGGSSDKPVTNLRNDLLRIEKYYTSSIPFYSDNFATVISQRAAQIAVFIQSATNAIRLANRRKEPFVFTLYGESGVGKSTLAAKLIDYTHVLTDNLETKHVAVVQATTKHADTITNRSTAVLFDDFANLKLEHQKIEEGPYGILWTVTGPTPAPVSKAAVEEKGNTAFYGHVVAICTNSEKLNADVIATKPLALIRRFGCMWEVSYSLEFQKFCAGGIEPLPATCNPTDVQRREWFAKNPDPSDSIVPNFLRFSRIVMKFENGQVERTLLPSVTHEEFLRAFDFEFKKQQLEAEQNLQSTSKAISICKKCNTHPSICKCARQHSYTIREEEFTVQPLDQLEYSLPSAQRFILNAQRQWELFQINLADKDSFTHQAVVATGASIIDIVESIFANNSTVITIILGGALFKHPLIPYVIALYIALWCLRRYLKHFRRYRTYLWASSLLEMSDPTASALSQTTKTMIAIGGVMGATAGMMKLMHSRGKRAVEHKSETDNATAPDSPTLLDVNSKETHFREPRRRLVNVAERAQTTSLADLQKAVAKNIYYMVMSFGGVVRRGDLFMIKQGLAVIPAHYVRDVPSGTYISFCLQRDGRKAAEITIPIGNIFICKDRDIALIPMILPDVPKNLEEYVTNETIVSGHVLAGKLVRCDEKLLDRDFNVSVTEDTYSIASLSSISDALPAYSYCLTIPSEYGFCGAVLLLDHGNFVTISGLHSGANCENPKICYAAMLTKTNVSNAMAYFGNHTTVSKGVCEVHSHNMSAEMHMRSIVRKISPDKGLYTTVVGVGNSTHTPRNNWLPYVDKEVIVETFGMEPTKIPVHMSKAAELTGAVKGAGPIHMFDNAIMDIAIDDFMVGVEEKVAAINTAIELGNTALRNVPLTPDEVIHGIPGNKVLKGFNMGTSAGYPFFKKKSNLFVPVTESDFVMIPDAEEAIKHAMDLVEARCANDTPFCSTLKSELKTVAKANDPRTFYTGGIASLFIVGKFAGPILQVFASDPIHFETFSGLDPVSPDAMKMHDYLASKSTDSIIAGDFKAMDKNLGPHLKLAVRSVFTRIAKMMKYTDSDITCLEVVFDHLIAPLIMVDGNTIVLPNVNTSGTYLTVIFNGGGCSIAFRYMLEEKWQLLSKLRAEGKSLRDIASVLTMGDDNNIALSEECLVRAPGVDCLVFRDFLKRFGMEYTSPDKGSELQPFYDLYETVFCQRKYTWNPEMEGYLLGIDPNIFVNAMCYHERKHSPEDVSMRLVALCNDFCRENAVYGKERYDHAQATAIELLTKLDIPIATTILESYETRIATFKTNGFYARHEDSQLLPNRADEHMDDAPSSVEMDGDPITTNLVDTTGVSHTLGSDPLPPSTGNTGTHLGSWTSRKVQIMRERFPPGALRKILFPFEAYLNHPSIKPKIDGYAGVRGNMQLTIEISCTPGHYASILYGLIPYDASNPVVDRFYNVAPRNWDSHTCGLLSQQSLGGKILLPDDKGAHMTVPLLTNKSYVSLASDLYLTGTSLCFMSCPDIRHFQKIEEPVTVIVYASMPDIELIGATAAAQYQSDEAIGPVTKVLSAAVDVAAFIAGVSANHSFPAHLSAGLAAARDIAAIAGFSRPVDVSAGGVVHLDTPYMSVTNVHDICTPLGMDAVNQVVLGPHIAGDNSDPMNISSIVSRDGLFSAFTWTKDIGMGSILCQFPVSPVAMLSTTGYMLPCGYIANMFEQWQGTLVYTFYLVATAYHAGSVSIEYDPVTARHTDADFPLVRKSLLDIRSLKKVEMTVHWQSPDFMKTNRTLENPAMVGLANAGSLSNTLMDNGTIKLRVQSPLTSNVASSAGGTSDCTILVYMRAHPDLSLAIPRDPYMGKYEVDAVAPEWINAPGDLDYYDLDRDSQPDVRTPASMPTTLDRRCIEQVVEFNPYLASYCGVYDRSYTVPSEGIVTVAEEDFGDWVERPAAMVELPIAEEIETDVPIETDTLPPATPTSLAPVRSPTWFPSMFGSSAPAPSEGSTAVPSELSMAPSPREAPSRFPTRAYSAAPSEAPSPSLGIYVNDVERMSFSNGLRFDLATGNYTMPTNVNVSFHGNWLSREIHDLTFTARMMFDEPCTVTFTITTALSSVVETTEITALGLQVLTVVRPILLSQIPANQLLTVNMKVSAGTPRVNSFKMPARSFIQSIVPPEKILQSGTNTFYGSYPIVPTVHYETPFVPWYEPENTSLEGTGSVAWLAEGLYLGIGGTVIVTKHVHRSGAGVTVNGKRYIAPANVGINHAPHPKLYAVYVERAPTAVEHMDSLLEPEKVPANNMLRQHFIGEGISSMRTMLRRSEKLGSFARDATRGTVPKWPISNGSSWHLYMLSAFLGVRGSYRVRMAITNKGTKPAVIEFSHIAVSKTTTTAKEVVVVRDFKMVTFELPYYCTKRYDNIWQFTPIILWTSNVGVDIDFYYCAGEDLTGVYYIGYPGARLKQSNA